MTRVVLHNPASGELVVTDDPAREGAGWVVVADPAPADIETGGWQVVNGALVAAPLLRPPRWITKFAYTLLWPAAANLAVHRSDDAEMIRAFSLFQVAPDPIDLNHPLVQAGISRAEQLGILSAAEAQRIRDGLPPI
jgi:hypothetical protein